MSQLKEFLFVQLERLPDPRLKSRCSHQLIDILVICLCSLLCGGTSYVDMEIFGNSKLNWLKKFLKLPNGIPSHDTFRRVLSILNPEKVEDLLREWIQESREASLGANPGVISMDGKCVTGTQPNRIPGEATTHPLSIVNVFDHTEGIAIGQAKANGRGFGEIPGALDCLTVLEIGKGTLITMDAAYCTQEILGKILEKKSNYLVPVKKNNRGLFTKIESIFSKVELTDSADMYRTSEKNRDRKEERTCIIKSAATLDQEFKLKWNHVKTVARITRIREEKDNRFNRHEQDSKHHIRVVRNDQKIKTSLESIYYICSEELSAKECLQLTRNHWKIENQLHWLLDVIFQEDSWRVRDKVAARTLSVLRKIALNLAKKDKTPKLSIRSKLQKAAWDNNFLEKLLFS